MPLNAPARLRSARREHDLVHLHKPEFTSEYSDVMIAPLDFAGRDVIRRFHPQPPARLYGLRALPHTLQDEMADLFNRQGRFPPIGAMFAAIAIVVLRNLGRCRFASFCDVRRVEQHEVERAVKAERTREIET